MLLRAANLRSRLGENAWTLPAYYITDRTQFAGDEAARRRALLDKVREAVCASMEYVQLREKDLSAGDLERLARDVVGVVQNFEDREAEI